LFDSEPLEAELIEISVQGMATIEFSVDIFMS